ncbi:MAG: 3-keto-5-aminohexanoate cleavage enzyme [Solirubrobacteraceae bacterium]
MSDVILTAALTGPVATKADHPSLPCSPQEIAEAARGACAAGAAVVHVHLRDEQGRPTARLDIAQRVVALIEESCPALVQLSTGVGLEVPFEDRERLVEARPRMATLNVCSMTFGGGEFRNPPDGVRRLAARMRELGVRPEIELYDLGHLEVALRLLHEDLLEPPLRFSVVMGVQGGIPATPRDLVAFAERIPEGSVWQVIGIGRGNLPMTAIGLAIGANARTGLEDTLLVRRGTPATSNAQLVSRLAELARALDRTPASPGEAAALLQLG